MCMRVTAVSAYNLRPSPNNYIAPGKRPMSSISTTIVTDDRGRVISLGTTRQSIANMMSYLQI